MTETNPTARRARDWLVVVALLAAPSLVIGAALVSSASAQADASGDADASEDDTSDDGSDEESDEEADSDEGADSGESVPDAAVADDGSTAVTDEVQPGDPVDQEIAEAEQADDSQLGDPAAEEEAPADAAEEEIAAEEAQAEREPLAWRNTFFSWTHGVTANSFVRDGQLSYNPLYYWSFSLSPRWYLDPATFLFVNQGLSYELTDSDGGGAYNHDPQLSDTIIDLRHTEAVEGFIFIPAVRLQLPVSKLSQAAQRYFMLGATITAVRVIPEAWSLVIGLTLSYRYWFAGSSNPRTMNPYPGSVADENPPTLPQGPAVAAGDATSGLFEPLALSQASAVSSIRHTILGALTLNITPVSGLNISFAGFWLSQEGHGYDGYCVAIDSSPTGYNCTEGDTSPTHWRHAYYASLSVAYDVLSWFNLSVGWGSATVLTPLFNQDGSVRSPFNPDNNFFLTATFQLDGIYEAIIGGDDDGLTPEQRQRRRQGLAGRSTSGGRL